MFPTSVRIFLAHNPDILVYLDREIQLVFGMQKGLIAAINSHSTLDSVQNDEAGPVAINSNSTLDSVQNNEAGPVAINSHSTLDSIQNDEAGPVCCDPCSSVG